jgi:hypothetical protein
MPRDACAPKSFEGWITMQINKYFGVKLVLAGALIAPAARAQNAAGGVLPVLEKKYQITELTADRKQITRNGTTMSMRTAGAYSLPATYMVVPDNKVSDGKVQSPSMLVRMTWVKMGSHVLQPGDKVYITKIDSKDESGNPLLKFTLLTTGDPTGGTDSDKKYQASISFRFKKGYLDETPPEEVEQAIEAILAPAADDTGQPANNASAQGPPQPGPPPPPRPLVSPPVVPPPPAAATTTVTIGESSTEVLQSMGMPLQMIDLGKKKTYVYKTMKITFVNDKVSDVQ